MSNIVSLQNISEYKFPGTGPMTIEEVIVISVFHIVTLTHVIPATRNAHVSHIFAVFTYKFAGLGCHKRRALV